MTLSEFILLPDFMATDQPTKEVDNKYPDGIMF